VQAATVLVEGIPEDYQSDEKVCTRGRLNLKGSWKLEMTMTFRAKKCKNAGLNGFCWVDFTEFLVFVVPCFCD
jgi:hypothetical protein